MRYFVDINQNYFEKINELISSRLYESVSQFILVAIENQLYLEKQGAEKTNKDIITKKEPLVNKENLLEQIFMGEKFNNIHMYNDDYKTITMPDHSLIAKFPQECDENYCWLWGQINRIFPIKLGLRILLNKLESKKWISFDEFKNEAANIASNMKQIIEMMVSPDLRRGRTMSAGLPKYEKEDVGVVEVEHSKARYKNQFLSYLRNKDNKIDGALAQLRFINLNMDNNDVKIGITKPGAEFAKIVNPIIDKKNFNETLSTEEINFYIKHIKENLPGEYEATIWLLEKINSGTNTRTSLNNELSKDYNEVWDVNDKVINTQRAGLMARITELRLIKANKQGNSVTYILNEFGKELIN